MSRKFLFLSVCLIFLAFANVNAQPKELYAKGFVNIKTSKGGWSLKQYAPNIIKATFAPLGSNDNSNLSDAVIASQVVASIREIVDENKKYYRLDWPNFFVEVKDETIIFDAKARVKINAGNLNSEYKTLQITLNEGEKIFGGGERALPLNRRGYKFNFYNNPWYGYGEGADNLNYSVPFLTSSRGYGLFFDNPSKGFADIGKTTSNVLEVGFTTGELNVYVIVGNSYEEILQSYHKLTGTQPLPPRWALGNFMSRFGYGSEEQVKEIAAKMKSEKIPFDAVIFDLFWFGDSIKGSLGNLEWVNKKAWPNPKQMISDFKKDGINTVLITEPFILKNTLNYDESLPFLAVDKDKKPYTLTDFYFGNGGIIDIFRKDAQQWFWKKYKQQMNLGVEAWWGDLGEPEKHPADLYHNIEEFDGTQQLYKSDAVHNLYGHTWTKMLFNNYAADYPEKRLFSLNRSGFAGSQRYGIFPWTGDVSRSWSGFKAQLPVLLGMSMSGIPYVHSDAGGFAGGEGDNELYVRWLQFATFTPIFRPHGTALYEKDPVAFSFPSEPALIQEPYKSYAKETIKLRYKLLPYNYSLAYQQTIKGSPLISPLYYYFQSDTTAIKVEDEYMWGKDILVAPVLEKSAKSRRVYLPAGVWYSNKNKLIGSKGEFKDLDVDINSIPFFFKGGSFVPMLENGDVNVANANFKKLLVQYIPSNTESDFDLFNDDGVNKSSLTNKNYSVIKFYSSGIKNGVINISILPTNLVKNDTVYNFKLIIPFAEKPLQVIAQNKPIEIKTLGMDELKGCVWLNDEKMLVVEVPFTGKQTVVSIKLPVQQGPVKAIMPQSNQSKKN